LVIFINPLSVTLTNPEFFLGFAFVIGDIEYAFLAGEQGEVI
jgi:hypothetical protein